MARLAVFAGGATLGGCRGGVRWGGHRPGRDIRAAGPPDSPVAGSGRGRRARDPLPAAGDDPPVRRGMPQPGTRAGSRPPAGRGGCGADFFAAARGQSRPTPGAAENFRKTNSSGCKKLNYEAHETHEKTKANGLLNPGEKFPGAAWQPANCRDAFAHRKQRFKGFHPCERAKQPESKSIASLGNGFESISPILTNTSNMLLPFATYAYSFRIQGL